MGSEVGHAERRFVLLPSTLGSCVGAPVDHDIGCWLLGLEVKIVVDERLGEVLGSAAGFRLGCVVGCAEGAELGCIDGGTLGGEEGICVGLGVDVGPLVLGMLVGNADIVGQAVG